ncbi:MAG: DUF4129 domain-containing protein, partial [Actinomycetota bacterium]|nr:DUF4129 domain-containing protein [Actinomycetota bacterium]
PAALEELRSIETVDGRPVDPGTALGGAEGAQLDRRLESLAEEPEAGTPGEGGAVDPSQAQRAAQEVLEQGKFSERDIPRPFRGLLDAIGRQLSKVWDWLVDLANDITGGNARLLAWGVLAVAAALGAIVGRRLIRARARKASRRREAHSLVEGLDPSDLESEADVAERQGDLEGAIRLRFRAGLVRLSRARAIPPQPSLTSGEVARFLRSRSFEEIAATFDEVVYGRRAARADDLETTKNGWSRVLEEKTGS